MSLLADKGKGKSALKVNEGVEQPSAVNDNAISRFKTIKRKKYTIDELVTGITNGDRSLLSRAITLLESNLAEHQNKSEAVVDGCMPYSGNSIRVGITGVPGVGKSTFIESLGCFLTDLGHKVAVLAIDPSSGKSKGSILGDKTRMEKLSANENAFIRPSPSAGSLGGVARKTRESIILCEAAGFDVILIETVGVGQSEIAVHSMADFFLLLMLAGAGDELQGIKRGIMEMADMITITKADSGNERNAIRAKSEYQNAVHLFPKPDSGWPVKVAVCSSKDNTGIDKIWENIISYQQFSNANGYFKNRRKSQSIYWMNESIEQQLMCCFYTTTGMKEEVEKYEKLVEEKKMTSFHAAGELLAEYFKRIGK